MGLQLLSQRFAFSIFTLSSMLWVSTLRATPTTCETKISTQEVGRFATNPIDEASGLALAPDGQHFFVTNDSGDKPRFFRTKLDGSNVEEFRVTENGRPWKNFDVEELSVGPCPKGLSGDCLALADIGDNRDRRRQVELAFIPLARLTSSPVAIAKKLAFKYPDGPRNAEAFAMLSARYGLIVTKEQDRRSRATKPAGVYIVDFETSFVAKVGEWDVPTWVRDQGLSALVTGLSVAPASVPGRLRILLLTYRDAIELVVETDILSAAQWPPRPWSVLSRAILKIDPLDQQEAVTYNASGTGFYYTSEAPFAMLGILGTVTAPIRFAESVVCR